MKSLERVQVKEKKYIINQGLLFKDGLFIVTGNATLSIFFKKRGFPQLVWGKNAFHCNTTVFNWLEQFETLVKYVLVT